MSSAVDEARFGRDLEVELDPEGGIRVTPTGDLPSVGGRDNLHAALRARALTSPSELLHRPDYGAGVLDQLEHPNTPTRRAQLANALRRNLLRDGRVTDVRASVSLGTPADSARGEATSIELRVTPRGETQSSSFTFSAE
ncbi:MAG: GPW/gp25 family protein [Chloroflexi bacterium]|nr:GPW/gp25 family protein [Chloroflexota bacterium]